MCPLRAAVARAGHAVPAAAPGDPPDLAPRLRHPHGLPQPGLRGPGPLPHPPVSCGAWGTQLGGPLVLLVNCLCLCTVHLSVHNNSQTVSKVKQEAHKMRMLSYLKNYSKFLLFSSCL